MPLEEALDRHSQAMNNLAEAIREGASIATGLSVGGKPATVRATATASKPATAATAPTPAAGQTATAPLAAGEKIIRYEEIKEGFMKVGEVKGNAVAIGLLGEFKSPTGVAIKSGKELLPADYQKFAARLKELLPPAVWATLSLAN
jgi:hypothetical protein